MEKAVYPLSLTGHYNSDYYDNTHQIITVVTADASVLATCWILGTFNSYNNLIIC